MLTERNDTPATEILDQQFGVLTLGGFTMRFVRTRGYLVKRGEPQHFLCDFAGHAVYVSAHAPSDVMYDVLVHLLAMAKLKSMAPEPCAV